jgi:hypothetical protein
MAQIVEDQVGVYDYAYRFSISNSPWLYGDLAASGGSYPGYWVDGDQYIPPYETTNGRPVGFSLTWYTDIPAEESVKGYSMPGDVLTNVCAPLSAWGEYEGPGTVYAEYECTVSNKAIPPHFEDEFEYNLLLIEPWNEKEGRIYWLSIEAVFMTNYVPDISESIALPLMHPEWGWKTTYETNIIDDAVVWRTEGGPPPPVWEELAWPDPGYPWPELFVPPSLTDTN